ncbi:hypothetical protein CC78DRAFT_456593 [Lojkania enalia]|uniref:Zn(2)-C6 fungal-type domain-containing protein n=1 Tax=Lojkania enalia TaxID=147567 RepID=A0A9P4N7Z9_9PLEO|nr:hypothetical protein CC78DRAFT_456593 [Didymosphaeria enalia]
MSGSRQRKQQKMAACVHCRQMKLKCDGNEKFPAPCSRCYSSGLNCHVDPLFKRTAKRERLNAVERQLREIRERLDAPKTTSPQETQPHPRGGSSATTTESPESFDPSMFRLAIQDIRTKFGSRILHSIELQPNLIAELVEEFYTNYHNQFPILPDVSALLSHWENSDLLFWTIMSISLRNKAEHRDTFLLLATSVRDLAFDIMRTGPLSLQSIQSFLLLCCWPPPFGATIDDPSLAFVSVATIYSMRLGLHRPKFPTTFAANGYVSSFDDFALIQRSKAWIGCFILNYCVSSYLGIPPTVQPDHSLLEAAASQPSWLPDSLFFQLQIARHGMNICSTLGNHEMTPSGLLPNPSPYLRAFDSELRLQETQLYQKWSRHDFINFLGCKMILYGFGVTAYDSNSEIEGLQGLSGYNNRLNSHHWTEQAYITASMLIQTACTMKEGFLFSMIHLQRWLTCAILFLLRLIIFPQAHQFDEAAIRNGINQGWELLRKCSLRENDHMARACAVIAYLSSKSHSGDAKHNVPTVRTQAKMGTNLVEDMVAIARERFSQHIRDQMPHDCTSAAAVEQAIGTMEQAMGNPPNDILFDDPFSTHFTEDWTTLLQNF